MTSFEIYSFVFLKIIFKKNKKLTELNFIFDIKNYIFDSKKTTTKTTTK
jgi:hypothetical protein